MANELSCISGENLFVGTLYMNVLYVSLIKTHFFSAGNQSILGNELTKSIHTKCTFQYKQVDVSLEYFISLCHINSHRIWLECELFSAFHQYSEPRLGQLHDYDKCLHSNRICSTLLSGSLDGYWLLFSLCSFPGQ